MPGPCPPPCARGAEGTLAPYGHAMWKPAAVAGPCELHADLPTLTDLLRDLNVLHTLRYYLFYYIQLLVGSVGSVKVATLWILDSLQWLSSS